MSHQTCHQSNPNLLAAGPVVSVGERHAKVRRSGYRKGPVRERGLDEVATGVVEE
jgi:hypothetical protein